MEHSVHQTNRPETALVQSVAHANHETSNPDEIDNQITALKPLPEAPSGKRSVMIALRSETPGGASGTRRPSATQVNLLRRTTLPPVLRLLSGRAVVSSVSAIYPSQRPTVYQPLRHHC